MDFLDGPEYLLPLDNAYFARGKERSEGSVTIERVDAKTIYFSSPLPAGIKAGDFLVKE